MADIVTERDSGVNLYDAISAGVAEVMDISPSEAFPVRRRGRPKANPEDALIREDRRVKFGSKLRQMRESCELTLAAAAEAAGISSARKLSQYETTCYPPGWVIKALAPVYKVSEERLASLVLRHSDPDMFEALKLHVKKKEAK